jgi:RNA polymerase sigma factor (sigma-70 family)
MSTDAAASVPGFGFERAWALVTPYYVTYGPELRRHACRRLQAGSVSSGRASELADDLVSEVILKALEAIQRGEHIENLPGWLHVAVERAAGKTASRAEKKIVLIEPQRLERPLQSVPDHSLPDPADAVAEAPDEELLKDLKAGLQQLTPTQRTVLCLLFVYELNSAEVADHLGMKASTVRVHKVRALAKLRMSLTSRGSIVATVVVAIAVVAAGLCGVHVGDPVLAMSSSPLRTRSAEDRRKILRTALQGEELQSQIQADLRRAGLR